MLLFGAKIKNLLHNSSSMNSAGAMCACVSSLMTEKWPQTQFCPNKRLSHVAAITADDSIPVISSWTLRCVNGNKLLRRQHRNMKNNLWFKIKHNYVMFYSLWSHKWNWSEIRGNLFQTERAPVLLLTFMFESFSDFKTNNFLIYIFIT